MRLEDKLVQSYSQDGEKRRVARHNWALLFLDLDKFKHVNDTLGHDVGDDLLKAVAARLQHCVRKSDYIFRLGGDEFTIILNDLINDADVAKVAQKIQEEVGRPCRIRDNELYITVSIGISVYPNDGEDVETLVKNADMAMYAAKEEGQGYRFFTEGMHRQALERMILESNLRNALHRNQFVLYYQPLVDDRHRIIGMEALLRWQHPELGMISPAKFIPLAEETGDIVPIGKWVLHTACQQARKWYDMGYEELYVAVNLSTRQFKEPDLVDTVEQVLETTGLPQECLKLEITEGGIMENPEQVIAKMKLLRAKGIRFSIDDFGTGYSSLSYLKRFPIDILKIDRSFVTDSPTNKDDQEIIKTIISMARNLNMDTVAEGVETEEQLDFLARQGCHMMQGYYFGRPMPADKFEDMLHTRDTGDEQQ
jgi:diguanylate cyclase (GGDEF)-like protein